MITNKTRITLSSERIITIILVIIYVFITDRIYKAWLYPNFDYFGYHYKSPSLYLLIITHLFAILPCLWIPIKLKRPTISIYWFVYLLLYIPSQLYPIYIGLNNNTDLLLLSIVLFFSINIIGSTYLLQQYRIKPIIKFTDRQFNFFLIIISVISILYLINIYGRSINFIGYKDIYTFRLKNAQLAQGTMAGYVILALGSSIFPIIMARGIIDKNKFLIIFSIVGQIFLFSTQGAKSNLLAPIILLFVYFIVYKKESNFGNRLTKYLIISLALILLIATLIPINNSSIAFYAISEIFVRIFSMEGLLTAQYYSFFSEHAYTYYTHINFIGKIFTYPYGSVPLGKVIGFEFTGNQLVNSNASFIATDGIAALGLVGIFIISFITAAVFFIIDSISIDLDVNYTTIALAFITLNLLNSSLFSTLLSGGLFLSMIIFNLTPRKELKGG